MAEANNLEPPKPGVGDVAHALAKAGNSSIPVVGSAASELLNIVFGPPIEKRRRKWMEDVYEALKYLESKKAVNIEDLQNDEAFIDTVMTASQAAIRTASKTKLESLRNAVINSALPGRPDESLKQIFVSLVDQFTEWHIKFLKLFQNPSEWLTQNNLKPVSISGMTGLVELAYPELKNQRPFQSLVWADLWHRGLYCCCLSKTAVSILPNCARLRHPA